MRLRIPLDNEIPLLFFILGRNYITKVYKQFYYKRNKQIIINSCITLFHLIKRSPKYKRTYCIPYYQKHFGYIYYN